MTETIPQRSEIPVELTADLTSVFPSTEAWNAAYREVQEALPTIEAYAGRLGESSETLREALDTVYRLVNRALQIMVYADIGSDVDTADQEAKGRKDRADALVGQVLAAVSFVEPEILSIPRDTLQGWLDRDEQLAVYRHEIDSLERRRAHVRSTEVEEVLGMLFDPFETASSIHSTLTDADMRFVPATDGRGHTFEIAQGTIDTLLASADREVRRTAWENHADAYLAYDNTMASCMAAGVKRDVFLARARHYSSSLEAALASSNIPTDMFTNLVETFRRNLPIWHKYWRVRREGLGYDTLYPWDIKAPLAARKARVPYDQAVEWVAAGMAPLGPEYVDVLRRGVGAERWVDIPANQGKRGGAYSHGVSGTHPFILMSYTDDLESMSTLAHELGHSLHSYFTWQTQPLVYADYSLFVAEVASNFNQALVRAYLMRENRDPEFQIALIEEAMSNFHRYLFIMPTLARFELEIHERAERGESLTAADLTGLMADLFAEGYGDEVTYDRGRVGITWAEFPLHLYANFYVYQYATGISAAQALARGVLADRDGAAQRYLAFLRAGSSLYPLEALELAGVDMRSPEPVEQGFQALNDLVDRLATLLTDRTAARS